MAENDIQPDIFKNKRRPDILRAKDIIPSRSGPNESNENEGAVQQEIPQFSLADDIMAEQRRLSAMRRKSPSSAAESRPQAYQRIVPVELKEPLRESVVLNTGIADSQSYTSQWDPVIADIVRRDIEMFCVVSVR